jgi:hypothetical protein
MAIFASIVLPAALHLDRDDIDRRVVVCATRFTIEFKAGYLWLPMLHEYRVEEFRGRPTLPVYGRRRSTTSRELLEA